MEIAFILLSDYSEAVNGKLYMTGGGWNILRFPQLPQDWRFQIGLGIDVGWNETNAPHQLHVTIRDPDGEASNEGLSGQFETGRPPGMPAGQDQRLVMSLGVTARFEVAGPHAAVVEVDGEELGRARFYVAEGPPPGQAEAA